MTEEEKPFATDYDGPWKEALDFAPQLFLGRFQPAITADAAGQAGGPVGPAAPGAAAE
jgi:hypothetical protein